MLLAPFVDANVDMRGLTSNHVMHTGGPQERQLRLRNVISAHSIPAAHRVLCSSVQSEESRDRRVVVKAFDTALGSLCALSTDELELHMQAPLRVLAEHAGLWSSIPDLEAFLAWAQTHLPDALPALVTKPDAAGIADSTRSWTRAELPVRASRPPYCHG